MAALGYTLALTLLLMARFYLKFSVIRAITLVFTAIFGLMIAFNFFEPVSAIAISNGWIPAVAQGLIFILLFGFGMAVLF
jgi:hypothetical protein